MGPNSRCLLRWRGDTEGVLWSRATDVFGSCALLGLTCCGFSSGLESDQFGYLVGAQGSLFALNSHCQYDYISLKENFARLGDTLTSKWFPNNRLIYPQLHQCSKTAHCVRSEMNTSTPGPRGLSEHLLNPNCPTDGRDPRASWERF